MYLLYLTDDLLQEVSRLASEGRFDYLIIESTGVSEPLPVAQTFTFTDELGQSLSEITRLDTMVTVVDAAHFLDQYKEAESLKERGEAISEEDERTVADLFVDQVEFADVILINKIDLVSEEDRRDLLGTVKALNPNAHIIETERSRVPLDSVLNTKRFDMEKLKPQLDGSKNYKKNIPLRQMNMASLASSSRTASLPSS